MKRKPYFKIGPQLYSLRKARELTQQQVADRIGVDRSTYAFYEKSTTRPSYEVLTALARLYDVSFAYLLGLTSHPGRFPDTEK